jgi:hypothetical protein
LPKAPLAPFHAKNPDSRGSREPPLRRSLYDIKIHFHEFLYDFTPKRNKLLEFALLDGFFQGIRNQPVKPLVTEGIFRPDDGFQRQFKLFPAILADRYGAAVKKRTIRKRLVNGLLAHITIHLLHNILLMENLHGK